MQCDELFLAIREWGFDKGILREPDNYGDLYQMRKAQANKTLEEVHELFMAIEKGDNDREEAMDAIGDIVVTLVMQAELWSTAVPVCMDQAYQVISKRTGKMVDNQFVKDGE